MEWNLSGMNGHIDMISNYCPNYAFFQSAHSNSLFNMSTFATSPAQFYLRMVVGTVSFFVCICLIVYHGFITFIHCFVNEKRYSKMQNILTWIMMIFYLQSGDPQIMWETWVHCTGTMFRIGCLTYQTAKAMMYCLFVFRLHIVYKNSIYAYNPRLLILWGTLIIILHAFMGIWGTITYIENTVQVHAFGRELTSCWATLDAVYIWGTLALDVINTCITLPAFIIPLVRLNKALQQHEGNNDKLKQTQKLRYPAVKATAVTSVALLSSIGACILSFIVGTAVFFSFDIPLNVVCVMLLSDHYDSMYRSLCCLLIKCMMCGVPLMEENSEVSNNKRHPTMSTEVREKSAPCSTHTETFKTHPGTITAYPKQNGDYEFVSFNQNDDARVTERDKDSTVTEKSRLTDGTAV
eukprot:270373_1